MPGSDQSKIRRAARWAAAGAALATLVSCGEADGPNTPAAAVSEVPEAAVVEVTTAPVTVGSIEQRISAPGSLVALRESHIGAEVRGRIEQVFVSEGDRVEAGAELFRIDPQPYEVALRQAKAGVDLARAERRQQNADLGRAKALLRKHVVAQQEIDRLETSLAVAQARERQAQEAVAMAKLELERTLVRAPYAGAVVARLADEGTTALVQPQTIVLVLQETSALEGIATIPETHIVAVHVGDRARLFVEGLPEPIQSTVSAVGDSVDPATRTYEVKMRVPNADHRLKAGVFAQVEILPQAKPDALLVPRGAIRTEEGRTRVLTVRDGRVVAVPVRVGVVSEEAAEVLAGLVAGDRVIVGDAAQTMAPGMRVRVRPEEPAAS